MRSREMRYQFLLNTEESERFLAAVKRSGLTQSAYLRLLINGLVPTDVPPPDYFAMTRELNAIGNNLNQIAYKAHAFGVLDSESFDKAVAALDETLLKITEAIYRHREVELWRSPLSGG